MEKDQASLHFTVPLWYSLVVEYKLNKPYNYKLNHILKNDFEVLEHVRTRQIRTALICINGDIF